MKFEISKKVLIIIGSSLAWLIVLGCILSFVWHSRDRFERGFGNAGCGMSQWNPAQMISGMENIIATKDYVAFQTLFSWTRILENINTPEKFATRVELQTTMKTVQDLEAKLWSENKGDFGPMMFGNKKWWEQGCPMMWGIWNERGNMMQRR